MSSNDNDKAMDTNIIDQYRMAHGLSYAKMATIAGFSARSVVYAHCHNRRVVSAESAVKYNRSFGIPLHLLRPDLWAPEKQQ